MSDSPAAPTKDDTQGGLAGGKKALPKRAGGGIKKPGAKSPRRRSREFAVQGLYEWLVAGSDTASVLAHMTEQEDFNKCDREHFDALLNGSIEQAVALDAVLARHVDRKTSLLSPVEHAVLMVGAYELMHCVEIPYRVAINEAVELAKTFGGTDGHRYVNGVLDKCATELRPLEARPRSPRPALGADAADAADAAGTAGHAPREPSAP